MPHCILALSPCKFVSIIGKKFPHYYGRFTFFTNRYKCTQNTETLCTLHTLFQRTLDLTSVFKFVHYFRNTQNVKKYIHHNYTVYKVYMPL